MSQINAGQMREVGTGEVGQSGDGERSESLRAPGGWMGNGAEGAWGIGLQRRERETDCDDNV